MNDSSLRASFHLCWVASDILNIKGVNLHFRPSGKSPDLSCELQLAQWCPAIVKSMRLCLYHSMFSTTVFLTEWKSLDLDEELVLGPEMLSGSGRVVSSRRSEMVMSGLFTLCPVLDWVCAGCSGVGGKGFSWSSSRILSSSMLGWDWVEDWGWDGALGAGSVSICSISLGTVAYVAQLDSLKQFIHDAFRLGSFRAMPSSGDTRT